jgi:SOS-response transcriptional repressor LexA
MTDRNGIAAQLKALRQRAGLSMEALAKQIGMKGASSYQRYENEDNYRRKELLPFEIGKKMARAMAERGDPPIQFSEIIALTGVDYTYGSMTLDLDGLEDVGHIDKHPIDRSSSKDLKVLGVAVGGQEGFFELNGSVVDYIERPSALFGAENAYAIFLVGSSMEPKYEEGQTLYVHPDRPPRGRDYVVVELQDGRAMVKRLIKRDSESVTLEQFNPPRKISVASADVRAIHKIVAADEMG